MYTHAPHTHQAFCREQWLRALAHLSLLSLSLVLLAFVALLVSSVVSLISLLLLALVLDSRPWPTRRRPRGGSCGGRWSCRLLDTYIYIYIHVYMYTHILLLLLLLLIIIHAIMVTIRMMIIMMLSCGGRWSCRPLAAGARRTDACPRRFLIKEFSLGLGSLCLLLIA